MIVVADASWIIALRDPDDRHHEEAVRTHRALLGARILLHPLTLAECLVAPAALGRLEEASQQLRAAYEVVDFDPGAPERWADLRAQTGLRLPDVVVLDTAHRGQRVVTFDGRLAGEAAKRNLV